MAPFNLFCIFVSICHWWHSKPQTQSSWLLSHLQSKSFLLQQCPSQSHSHPHAHTHTFTLTHSLTFPHPHTHTHTHTHSTPTHTNMHTFTQTCTHSHTHAFTANAINFLTLDWHEIEKTNVFVIKRVHSCHEEEKYLLGKLKKVDLIGGGFF